MNNKKIFGILIIPLLIFGLYSFIKQTTAGKPNILFIIADDWSYPHAGIYGDSVVKTPNFDRIAKEGILFNHAYVSSPSCTPSRASTLAGQHFWRLHEGANLYGPLRPEYSVYPDILEEAGYQVGYKGKGWGPGIHEGRSRNPAGNPFKSFKEFLDNRSQHQPFCFWFGSYNPHRGYKKGSGEAAGIEPESIQLPACFPDHAIIRKDVADYYLEVQDFDDEVGALLAQLEAIDELDNTLIVVTGDNGLPFPRCKSNLYDLGTRVPLAVRWGDQIRTPQQFDDLVSLTDMAPTFLEAANLSVPKEMTGLSLLPFFKAEKTSDYTHRNKIFFGKERHVPGQEMGDWGGYPMRAVRTRDFLYIRNFAPDLWPAGTPDYQKATFYPSYYGDVDGGPTRTYIVDHRADGGSNSHLFSLAFEKRLSEELYDLKNDPDQLINVAGESNYTSIKNQLEAQLMQELKSSNDPRVTGGESIFKDYPYTGGAPFPDDFIRQSPRYATQRIDNFPSKYVTNRTIEVLTPVNINFGESYPVIYMFDGQNIFHTFKGWEDKLNSGWRVDDVLDSLNLIGSLPQAIIVGIFNSQEKRGSEYMPEKPRELLKRRIEETTDEWYTSFKENSPQSDKQLKFIVEEIKPFIDQNFKTKTDRANTFVAGSSMGGLISAYAICEYPDVFGGAACLSTHWPALDGVFLEYLKNNLPDPATHKIYFDHGTEELDAQYEPFQKKADEAMEKHGFVQNKNWITMKFEGAKHHEDDWHDRFHIPLSFLLAGK